jgi:hypothetical protein
MLNVNDLLVEFKGMTVKKNRVPDDPTGKCINAGAEWDTYLFHYEVLYSSFGCSVFLEYEPIGSTREEDEGYLACDVDVSGGGDCVGPRDVVVCMTAAIEMHEKEKHNEFEKLRATDG